MSKVGIAESEAAQGWTLALIVGLLFSAPTAITGFADWLQIARGTPLWRTATAHMIAMLTATVFFLVAIGAGYGDGIDGAVERRRVHPDARRLRHAHRRRLARRHRGLHLRDAGAQPGRGTGESCHLADPSTGS